MQKRFLVILLSLIFFIAGSTLGISVVYRVDEVTVQSSLVSEEAKGESIALQNRLQSAYKKESIFFASDDAAKKILKDFPYFRLIGFEKDYPNRVVIKIVEDAEVYAVECANGYYILGADGMTLGLRNTHVNELNGAENVIIKGVSVTAENGGLPTGDVHFVNILNICKEISALLNGIRSNVVSVEVFSKTPETIYRFTMREGVKLYFGNPDVSVKQKAELAVAKYMSLSYEEKLGGRIVVSDVKENVFANYSAKDEFAN